MAKLKAATSAPSPVAPAKPGRGVRRDPRPMLTTELTPAMKFYLMVGTHSEARVRGWARAAQDDPTPDTVWDVYCDVLIAEAAAAGFTPWRVSKVPPSGPGFEAWRARFLKTFGY